MLLTIVTSIAQLLAFIISMVAFWLGDYEQATFFLGLAIFMRVILIDLKLGD